jgi:mannose-6-phosphate isomerase-like protein (cupin superfamily)
MEKIRMRMKIIPGVLGVAFVMLAQEPNPTCHRCSASYIPQSELDAYVRRAMEHHIIDQQVRSIDLGKSQVGIGVVTRGKLAPGSTGGEAVAEHEQVSEVYYIIEGTATLLTGPDLVDPKRRPDNLKTVREQNGPGYNSKSIRNPMATELKAGDVIVIPAGTGHWFTKIDDHITYMMVRIDPDKVVPTKSEEQSLNYLKSEYKPEGKQ